MIVYRANWHIIQQLPLKDNRPENAPKSGMTQIHSYLDVKEAGAGNVGDGRAHLLPGMDHVHPKRVHSIPANVVPVDPGYQHLPLVIVHKQSPNHVARSAFQAAPLIAQRPYLHKNSRPRG